MTDQPDATDQLACQGAPIVHLGYRRRQSRACSLETTMTLVLMPITLPQEAMLSRMGDGSTHIVLRDAAINFGRLLSSGVHPVLNT